MFTMFFSSLYHIPVNLYNISVVPSSGTVTVGVPNPLEIMFPEFPILTSS